MGRAGGRHGQPGRPVQPGPSPSHSAPVSAEPAPGADAPIASPRPNAVPATIDPAFYYALLRAGLPTDPASLYRTSPDAVEAIWKTAAGQGVIPPALGDKTESAREAFLSAASAGALMAPPLVGPSTLGQLLQVPFGTDGARQQQEFANLLVRFQNDPTMLWTEAEKAFGATASAQLQLVGQLAYLTANNAPLIAALYQAEHEQALSAPVDLVVRGYHRSSAWEGLLTNVDPPAEIAGSTPAEKKASYANLLAAHVRLSFPTATVGQLAKDGDLGTAVQSSEAVAFLASHQATFDIGDEPIQGYLSRTKTQASTEVIQQITRLQRVYQITPDATSLGALLAAGLDSAYAVTRISPAAFVKGYAQALGGQATAEAVYARAQSINASTLHVALSYLGAKRAPSVGSGFLGSLIDPLPVGGRLLPGQPGAEAQATLEALFQDLDYCQCDDCQSITSPAAYLVDLLDWIDNTKPSSGRNPLDALRDRRPDIFALQLTCDNTNIALPYVDLVNETLEYFVAGNESLANYQGYNADPAISSAELIASPQNDDNPTARNAYEILKTQWFPPPLPFYRDLELLRQHIARLNLSLYEVMHALRATDGLERPDATDPSSYGWRDILSERVGLSRLEYQLLTDSTALTLADVYGYPTTTSAAAVINAVSPLQEYSRRTGVSYSDLVSILQCRFINPDNTGNPIVIDVAGQPCDTSMMRLQYLEGSSLLEVDLVQMMRFIRLWRKLGLSIRRTDNLISTLYASTASSSATALQQLDSGFLLLLPRIGVAYAAVDLLGLDPATDLEALLTCWGPIGTDGVNPSTFGCSAIRPSSGWIPPSRPTPTATYSRGSHLPRSSPTGLRSARPSI